MAAEREARCRARSLNAANRADADFERRDVPECRRLECTGRAGNTRIVGELVTEAGANVTRAASGLALEQVFAEPQRIRRKVAPACIDDGLPDPMTISASDCTLS